jgi:tetratricopeptide (TPR) repeat protein
MIRLLVSAVAALPLIGAAAAGPREDCYQAFLASSVVLAWAYPPALSPYPNRSRAIEACSEVLRSAPSDDKVYFIRGQAYAWGFNYDQAIADYTRVVEINSGNANPWSPRVITYLNRGIAYQYKGDQSRGLADINKAIELNPDYAPAYYIRGVTYEVADGDRTQNYSRAFADYTKAIESDPNYASAYIGRSRLHGKTGAADRALSDLDKASDIVIAGAINPRYVDIIKNWFSDYFPRDDSPLAGEAK